MAGLDHDDWRLSAACAGQDPELWFPDMHDDTEYPLRVCRSCPVIAKCRLAGVGESGIWGGVVK